MVPEAGSKQLNAVKITQMLPVPRVVAWVCGWCEVNALAISRLHKDACKCLADHTGLKKYQNRGGQGTTPYSPLANTPRQEG